MTPLTAKIQIALLVALLLLAPSSHAGAFVSVYQSSDVDAGVEIGMGNGWASAGASFGTSSTSVRAGATLATLFGGQLSAGALYYSDDRRMRKRIRIAGQDTDGISDGGDGAGVFVMYSMGNMFISVAVVDSVRRTYAGKVQTGTLDNGEPVFAFGNDQAKSRLSIVRIGLRFYSGRQK